MGKVRGCWVRGCKGREGKARGSKEEGVGVTGSRVYEGYKE